MPEYLHPGVYVVEVDGAVRPIEGVSTSTAGFVDGLLLRPLRALAERLAPGWTEPNDHDPGVTLLSLLAWIGEATLFRTEPVSDESAVAAAKLAAVALRALQDRELPAGSGVRKVRFFQMASDERAIREVHTTWIDAVNAGDLARLLTLMADDVVFLNPGRAPFGRDEFPAGFSTAHQQSRLCCVSELEEIVVVGEIAYTLSRDSLSVTPRAGGEATELAGHRITVYRKQPDGRWLLARDAHTLSPVAN